MTEIAVVVDLTGQPLHWHLPPGRTAHAIPDSRELWEVMWRHREQLAGIAHSHPGGGVPVPSKDDLTTFAACESALGKRIRWWIVTSDHARCYLWEGPGRLEYTTSEHVEDPPWLDPLRAESFGVRAGA